MLIHKLSGVGRPFNFYLVFPLQPCYNRHILSSLHLKNLRDAGICQYGTINLKTKVTGGITDYYGLSVK